MLHSEVGASARPLKTVRAVGATKDLGASSDVFFSGGVRSRKASDVVVYIISMKLDSLW
jgi:hypothetical protein